VTTRQVAIVGGIVGLIVSVAVLIVLWFGVLGALRFAGTNLAHVLWPSSLMLTRGWCSTVPGIMTTISSIAINCLLYAAIALGLRACFRLVVRPNPQA